LVRVKKIPVSPTGFALEQIVSCTVKKIGPSQTGGEFFVAPVLLLSPEPREVQQGPEFYALAW
jgi:hypothetical protein